MKKQYEQAMCDGDVSFSFNWITGNPVNATENKIVLHTKNLADFTFESLPPPFYILVSTSADYEAMLVTEVTKPCPSCNVTLNVVRGKANDDGLIENPKNLLWTHDPYVCDSNLFPDDTPPEWVCDSANYWGGDGKQDVLHLSFVIIFLTLIPFFYFPFSK